MRFHSWIRGAISAVVMLGADATSATTPPPEYWIQEDMRDLAPHLVFLIDRQNKSRRQDRNPPIGRQNLEWILNGHPEAVPLFSLDASSSGVLRSSSN